jgi:hypothetical protein
MSEHLPHSDSLDEPEYGPTYYAPVELPMPRLPRPPFWMIALALIFIVATWLPLAIIARGRVSVMSEPRIQLMQDMGIQPKFREQMTNPLFADDRAMRPKIPGTVARGSLEEDDDYYRGFVRKTDGSGKETAIFVQSLPSRLTDSPEKLQSLVQRGQQRFNIYCYVSTSGRWNLRPSTPTPPIPSASVGRRRRSSIPTPSAPNPTERFLIRLLMAFAVCRPTGRRFPLKTDGPSSRTCGRCSSVRAARQCRFSAKSSRIRCKDNKERGNATFIFGRRDGTAEPSGTRRPALSRRASAWHRRPGFGHCSWIFRAG